MKMIFAFLLCLLFINPSFAQSAGGSVGGSTTVCSGTNSGLLTLSGHTGNIVRWQSSTSSGASWTNISNTTTNLVYSNLTTTTWYRAEVLLAPSPPNISDYSVPAIITVDAASSATINTSTSVCYGSNNGILTLNGIFTSVTGWDSSTDAGLNWSPLSNTTINQNYSNITSTTLYRAIVSNGTCPSIIVAPATITVNPITVGGTVSGTTTVCAGSNSGTLNLNAHTGSIMRWQSSTDGGISWSNITNTASYYNFSNITQSTEYRAVVQSGNCIAANSTPATIIVSAASDGGTVSSDATVCNGTNNGTLELNGYSGNIIRWESSINNGSSWTAIVSTSDKYSYNNLSASTLFRAVVKSGNCTTANSTPASITVSSLSVGGAAAGTDTICSGSNSGILTLNGHIGNVIRWQSSDDAGLSWSNISNTTGSNTCNFTNITTTTDFRAVVQNGACPAANSTYARMTVLPVSDGGTLSPATYSACSGINSGTILLSGQSGSIIYWESSTDGGLSWSQITNTTSSQSFNNLTASTLFRALVQQGQCIAAHSTPSTISVVPATIGGSITGSDTVCTGTNNGTLILNGNTGNILNWEYSKNGGGTWTNLSNTSAILNYTNLTTTTIYRAAIQSGSCASANSATATIIVNPVTIGGSVFSSTTICDSTTSGTLTLSGNTGSILNWQYSIDSGSTWVPIPNTSNTYIYSGITTETMYKVLVQSPACSIESSTPATISLATPVVASFTFSTNGTTSIFTNTSSTNGGTSLWNFGDNSSSSIESPAHTYTTIGLYNVQLIISDSCGSDTTSQLINITGLGINEAYNNPNIHIYPNPFSTTTTIEFNLNPLDVSFKIIDLYGEIVRMINVEHGSKILKLEREDLPSGIYFYQIQSSQETISTGKIVIQ